LREHIVRSFEQELRHVGEAIAKMGVIAEEQLQAACSLIGRSDPEAVRRTVARDEEIDRLDLEVARSAMRLLALRQPLAVDLRETLVAIKVSGDLERIGDLAKNIAKRAGVVGGQGGVLKAPPALEEMARMVRHQLDLVVGAYADRDAAGAERVWRGDERLDDWYESLFRELLTYMMEDPRTITSHTHLLFIAKNLERVGDHCANVGASVYYLVTGEALSERRPKGADARLSVVEPPGDGGRQ
jgi:phosphate transport system protein